MRLFKQFCFTLLLCYFVSPTLLAQNSAIGNPAQAGNKGLEEQFDALVNESNNYQRFKVVPKDWLNAFKVNLADSLKSANEQSSELAATIERLENEVAAQETAIQERDASIVALNEEKDGISFLGNNMSKGVYNTLVWGLAAALLAGMLFFLARSRYAVSVSKGMEESNTDLAAELEKSKRRRLEVEQDLRRKLQDERNKRNGGGEA